MNEWAVLLCIVLFIASAFGLSERVERRDGMETGAQKRGNIDHFQGALFSSLFCFLIFSQFSQARYDFSTILLVTLVREQL